MRKKVKVFGMVLSICCLLFFSFSYVMATEHNNISAELEKCNEKIYNTEGVMLEQNNSGVRASCTHIPCNQVTDTVWQHRHNGLRCDVYTANATWCKCCNTILQFNSGWVYSYTHYGCNL